MNKSQLYFVQTAVSGPSGPAGPVTPQAASNLSLARCG